MKSVKITVCAACLRACCWQGYFMCDKSQGADTKGMPLEELQKLGREHPEWWDVCPHCGVARTKCKHKNGGE